MTSKDHPWALVAPWYRWPRQVNEQGLAASPRETRPALQKFDDPGFVDHFLRTPQRSLVFDEVRDRVQRIVTEATSAGEACRRPTKYAPKVAQRGPDGKAVPTGPESVWMCPSDLRKIYLDVHRRHYLVTCELHCDRPHFPRVRFDEVARAGFVVRRRRQLKVPAHLAPQAKAMLDHVVALETQLADLDEVRMVRPAAARRRTRANDKLRAAGAFDELRAKVQVDLHAARAQLSEWTAEAGIVPMLEGWFETETPGIGYWRPVEDKPTAVDEAVFPLYPLRPDPKDRAHDGADQSIYFGVLPTSSLDTDRYGAPRFDAESRFEVWCFAQKHAAECPPPARPELAHGEVVWSRPSEAYQLARATDPLGCANRITNIELPDFKEMVALAAATPAGQLVSTRVSQPQGLLPVVDDGKVTGGSIQIGQICFFAIPLITIVAIFLFKLIMPIVVFIFGLWFLLAFKFCIPPSVSLDAGLQAQLEADLSAGVEIDASFDMSAAVGLSGMIVGDEGITEYQFGDIDDGDAEARRVLATMYVHAPNEYDTPGRSNPDPNARAFGPALDADRAFEPRVDVEWSFG